MCVYLCIEESFWFVSWVIIVDSFSQVKSSQVHLFVSLGRNLV